MSFDDSHGETFLYELARDGQTTEVIGYLKRGSSPAVRKRAAELLGDFADHPDEQRRDEIVQELIGAVKHGDSEEVRSQAIDSLVRYGDEAIKRLIDRFSEFDARGAPRWLIAENLIEWLDDDRPEFRLVAAAGLEWFGDEGALPALVEAFTDPDPRVRRRAVRSCGAIGDDRIVEALAGRLTDPDTRVEKEAASALGAIGTAKALDALIPAARSGDSEVRQIAIDQLGQYGSLDPLPVLLRALEDESGPIRRTAVVALIELFVQAPSDQSHEMRSTVADRLDHLSPADVVPELVDVVRESDRWAIRRNAVWLLRRFVDEAGPNVQECLVETLDAEDETTAQLAATTLAELGGDGLEKRVLLFLQDIEEGSAAWNRGQFVLDRLGTDPGVELVNTGVSYTYVSDPEDYTGPERE